MKQHNIVITLDEYETTLHWEFNFTDEKLFNVICHEIDHYNKWIKRLGEGKAPTSCYEEEEFGDEVHLAHYCTFYKDNGFDISNCSRRYMSWDSNARFHIYDLENIDEEYEMGRDEDYLTGKYREEISTNKILKKTILRPYDNRRTISLGYRLLPGIKRLLDNVEYHGHKNNEAILERQQNRALALTNFAGCLKRKPSGEIKNTSFLYYVVYFGLTPQSQFLFKEQRNSYVIYYRVNEIYDKSVLDNIIVTANIFWNESGVIIKQDEPIYVKVEKHLNKNIEKWRINETYETRVELLDALLRK